MPSNSLERWTTPTFLRSSSKCSYCRVHALILVVSSSCHSESYYIHQIREDETNYGKPRMFRQCVHKCNEIEIGFSHLVIEQILEKRATYTHAQIHPPMIVLIVVTFTYALAAWVSSSPNGTKNYCFTMDFQRPIAELVLYNHKHIRLICLRN